MDIFQVLAQVGVDIGTTLVCILLAIFATSFIRYFAKVPGAWSAIICLAIGVLLAVAQILLAGTQPKDWIKTIGATALGAIALYMLVDKYRPVVKLFGFELDLYGIFNCWGKIE